MLWSLRNASVLVASSWTPSIVPRDDDANAYMVLDDLGRTGRIWPEADAEKTDLETVIADLLNGQYKNPVRVVGFNTAERWSEYSPFVIHRAGPLSGKLGRGFAFDSGQSRSWKRGGSILPRT